MAEAYDAGESIYSARVGFISEMDEEFDFLLDLWLKKNNFSRLTHTMVHTDAQNCWMAGAIAYRKKHDQAAAFKYWQTARRTLIALDKAIDVRQGLPADTKFDSMYGSDSIPARYFYHLLICLLFCGDRAGLAQLRSYFDLPLVVICGNDSNNPDSYAAEARMLYAAWEGDASLVASFTAPLELEYKRYRIADIYTKLWHAVATRQNELLDSLLPAAEEAYKKAARRKDNDIWGGGKDYNEAMFDTYTTAVLKVAKDVGMHWKYGNANTAELWPAEVINHWGAQQSKRQ